MINEIIQLLEDEPQNWIEMSNACLFIHKGTGIALWIGNGRSCLKIYQPIEQSLSFFEKRRLWKAVKMCKANIVLLRILEKKLTPSNTFVSVVERKDDSDYLQ